MRRCGTHEKDAREERLRRLEALAAGNPDTDIDDDWIDYEAAGATGPGRPARAAPRGARRRRPRRRRLPARPAQPHAGGPARRPVRAASSPRATISASACAKSQSEHYVEMFDPDRYVVNASVMENLVFGVADTDALGGRLEDHAYLVSVIAETGLERKLLDDGPASRRDADRPLRRSGAEQSAARAHGPDGAGGDRHLPRDRAARGERRLRRRRPRRPAGAAPPRLRLCRAAPPPRPARRRRCRRRSCAARKVFRAQPAGRPEGRDRVLPDRASSMPRRASRTTSSSAASSTPTRRPPTG